MDQLGHKIKDAVEAHFQAKLTSFAISKNADMWGMNFGNLASTYKVSLSIVESKHKLMTGEHPAHSINSMMKNGMWDRILDGNGKLMSMSTNMSHGGFETDLEFITHDIVGFANSLHDFGWKSYSKEFDSLMTEQLSED